MYYVQLMSINVLLLQSNSPLWVLCIIVLHKTKHITLFRYIFGNHSVVVVTVTY